MNQSYLTIARLHELRSKLSQHDLRVLRSVAQLRFLSGAQLMQLHFADAQADPAAQARSARRALLRLTKLGLLARLPRLIGGVRAGSAGFVYHLDVAGQRLSMELGWQPKRRGRRSVTPGLLFLHHSLRIAELHVQLHEADRSRRIELLELTAEPVCWRSYDGIGSQRPTLKPDSFVRLGLGAYEDSYFVEVDRGTEGSRAVGHQLQAYVAYYRSGVEQTSRQVFPKVLWTAETDERVGMLAAGLLALPPDARQLFQVVPFDQAVALMADEYSKESATYK